MAFNSTIARALGSVGGAFAAMDGARRALKSAISLEREMYNIQRATDSSGDVLKSQENFILDLARATGKTKEELAKLYAAAGFAGRPNSELGRFTEYASKATVAWGTNAEETGQALAEIGNIFEANQKRIEGIGDAINTVADGSASSEKDLIEILRRVGGAGKGLGISAENMLAFGAALKEVGVGTEVASTGLNAMLTKISVPDDKFDEALTKIGLKPKAFRKSVDKDATGSIMTLLGALKKLEGTKRIAVLKDMFGMEYADDISRMVGGLDRITKLLALANDKAKALGSVRSGFGIAIEKDFNKLDRAQASIDTLLVRTGNHLKIIAGGFADVINEAVDASESASRRLERLRKIDEDAADRAGKPGTPGSKPEDQRAKDQQTLAEINAGKYDAAALPYVIAHAKNPEIIKAAEDSYRRQRYGAVDEKDAADEQRARDTHARLSSFDPLASKTIPMRDRPAAAAQALDIAEAIRKRRMEREFNDMQVGGNARKRAGEISTALASQGRLGSFGTMPVTTGTGKGAKTYEAPKVDMSDAGTTAGASYVNSLNSELDRGIVEAKAKIEQLKTMLKFSTSATINIEVRKYGAGVGGFDTGKQGPN
ncbi:phage tail tape measure protein [Bosea vaviloviae]|nr:phage tail tape measure protein [Bosea vaviloviae]